MAGIFVFEFEKSERRKKKCKLEQIKQGCAPTRSLFSFHCAYINSLTHKHNTQTDILDLSLETLSTNKMLAWVDFTHERELRAKERDVIELSQRSDNANSNATQPNYTKLVLFHFEFMTWRESPEKKRVIRFFRVKSGQLQSTQLNPTQLNPTQLKSYVLFALPYPLVRCHSDRRFALALSCFPCFLLCYDWMMAYCSFHTLLGFVLIGTSYSTLRRTTSTTTVHWTTCVAKYSAFFVNSNIIIIKPYSHYYLSAQHNIQICSHPQGANCKQQTKDHLIVVTILPLFCAIFVQLVHPSRVWSMCVLSY